jgi:CIC family chloride channel protein
MAPEGRYGNGLSGKTEVRSRSAPNPLGGKVNFHKNSKPMTPPQERKRFSPSQRLTKRLHQFRYSLSYAYALPQLTLLGLIVGLITGLTVIAFRLCIELPLGALLPSGAESFEQLSPIQRLGLLTAGATGLFVLLTLAGKSSRQVSVSHVLDRLHNHQGHLPTANWLVQFIGGVLSVVGGQSVGREGPVVHLGAGVASRISHTLQLPHNSRYTLIACGVAAAISASFDTPLAGVIFAMEVILIEYTIAGFVPVILAAVSGAALSHSLLGGQPLLQVAVTSRMQSLWDLPFVLILGVVIACAGAAFIAIHVWLVRYQHWPLVLRLILATLLMAVIAWPVPEVMGLGYDTLNAALAGELPARTLLVVGITKLVASAAVIALGVPGGIIGPTLITGACLGGAMGMALQAQSLLPAADPGLYVIIGMAGMMAAVLNAPLAALVAVLELSYSPHMIFPSMLVVVIACLITRHLFDFEGIFMEQLRATGRALEFHPATQLLKKTGIANAMETRLVQTAQTLNYSQAKQALATHPEWVVLETGKDPTGATIALRAADLAAHLAEGPADQPIDLLAIPARRLLLSPIRETASLWDALETLRTTRAEAVYLAHTYNPFPVRGIVTEEAIKNFYRI